MASNKKDPTSPIRLRASRYPDVEEGTSCTQTSFKAGKQAFLYVGMQGGRYKAMFKLKQSMPEAARLAKRDPDHFGVGSNQWVTARFTADEPMPKKTWTKWLDESHDLSVAAGGGRTTVRKKPAKAKTTGKKAARKRE